MQILEDRLSFYGTEKPRQNGWVLYWMQASVRLRDNLALNWAAEQAKAQGLALAVLFTLDASFPEANERSFAFLLEGLDDVAQGLAERGLTLTVVQADPFKAVTLASERAAFVVIDRGYTAIQRHWRRELAKASRVPLVGVEDNLGVPIRTASNKEEWAAATLRPKLLRALAARADETESSAVSILDVAPADAGPELAAWLGEQGLAIWHGPFRPQIRRLAADAAVAPVSKVGGEKPALELWQSFLDTGLARYSQRNDPLSEAQSGLAPYFHFGHLSPLSLIRDLKSQGLWRPNKSFIATGSDPVAEFLDEVLIRRELAANFVFFQPRYADYESLPDWAQRTLELHQDDARAFIYTEAEWEAGLTHDEVWNTCQQLLVHTGTMPGYLRMYWGKKILEWSATPRQAFSLALRQNNRWALDGRDPNSWAGVAWCFGKHDRPWGERAVWGSVRSMVQSGLMRKFDVDAWLEKSRSQLPQKNGT